MKLLVAADNQETPQRPVNPEGAAHWFGPLKVQLKDRLQLPQLEYSLEYPLVVVSLAISIVAR